MFIVACMQFKFRLYIVNSKYLCFFYFSFLKSLLIVYALQVNNKFLGLFLYSVHVRDDA